MSGFAQVNFRMPQELKEKLEQAAKESGRSITSELVTRLEQSFNKNNSDARNFTLLIAALSQHFTEQGKDFKEFQKLLYELIAIMDDPNFADSVIAPLNKKPTA